MKRITLAGLTLSLLTATGAVGQGGPPAGMPCPGGMCADSATRAQMMDIRDLVMNHDKITRTVTLVPGGIRTVTESSDPRIAQILQAHVNQMDQRANAGSHIAVPMESPALKAIMDGAARIRTSVEKSERGVIVQQVSSDSALVVALRQHAEEVSSLVAGGMNAMHQAMMSRGMMPGMMPGMMMNPPGPPPAKRPPPR